LKAWHETSAVELAAALKARRLSPVELLACILAQYERVNPSINAVVAIDRDGALQAARKSEARFLRGEPLGPLDGIPVSVKDNLFVRDLPATWGSIALKEHVPTDDELPIERLRGRGAVIFGKTNVPEFTLEGHAFNRLFGATRNPWDLSLTSGGSSGGAVAAVATGIGPLALGTDGGGSTRRPAGFNKLVGFKPSIGRIARGGGFPEILYDLEVIGLIGRSVEDVRMLHGELAGPHPFDRRSWAVPSGSDRRGPSTASGKRIRLHLRFDDSPVDPRILRATEEAAERLRQSGCEVEITDPEFSPREIAELVNVLFACGLVQIFQKRGQSKDVGEPLLALHEYGCKVSGAQYLDALTRIWHLRNHSVGVFRGADFLMTPTSAAMPWPCNEPYPPTIDGIRVGPRGHAVFTGFVNLLGLPAISLPAPTEGTLPIGFQLVGRFGDEEALFELARAYEARFPWADEWPSVAR
jgi:aspartyl-tRNA(Asn)/glutamyl-tRNA(Gln) amidotransferase subunit A